MTHPTLTWFERAWGPSLGELVATDTFTLSAEELEAGLHTDVRAAESLVREALRAWLWSRNQFVTLSEDAEDELDLLVDDALDKLVAQPTRAGVLPALQTFRASLAAFVREHYGDKPREVVCAEYTPALQLEVLGVRLEDLRAPVLDIGCGPHAALVGYLREQGIEARGFDRLVHAEHAEPGDWLTFPYEAQRPRTALSHLGFSLHFLHHHLAGGDTAFAYARAYMNILRALTPRGRFVYTPGLPFLEDMLDADLYRVKRVKFAGELRVASLRQIERSTGLSLSYASHVERVS